MRLCSVEGYRLGELVRSGGAGAADVRRQTMKVEMCLEQAIDAYSRLSALWPDYAELHYNYGLVFNSVADQLRYEEKHGLLEGMSKEIPRKLTEKTPEEWEALSLEHNVVMGKMSQKMEVALQLGRKYMDQGMQEEAVALLREASERYPTEEMLLQEYLSAAYQHKEVDAQLDALWKMWLINPMNDLFLNHLLNLAEQNSRDEWLTRAVAKLEEYNPVDWRVAAYRLEMYAKSREIEPMLLQLDRLLRCDGAKSKAIAVGCEAASQAGMRDAFNAILNEHGVPAVCEE
jgi:tetratricopeptide (TPR) repeat protein